MTRHALTVGAIAVVVGFVLLLGLPESVDENGPVDDATTGTTETTASSFSAQTQWGEPNLADVWRAAPLGASAGSDNT